MTPPRLMHTLIFIAVLHVLASLLPAQSPPPIINYQGRLVDAEGTPLTGPQALAFAIYDAPTSGTIVWGPQTFPNVPLVDGAFNVLLGIEDPAAGGDSVTAAFTGSGTGPRFFAVFVGGVQTGDRQQVVSVPYALTAASAGSIVVDTGSIVDGAVTTPKLGDGAVTSSKILDGSVATVDLQTDSVDRRALDDYQIQTARITASGVFNVFSLPEESLRPLPGLSVTIPLSGERRPVVVGLRRARNTVTSAFGRADVRVALPVDSSGKLTLGFRVVETGDTFTSDFFWGTLSGTSVSNISLQGDTADSVAFSQISALIHDYPQNLTSMTIEAVVLYDCAPGKACPLIEIDAAAEMYVYEK